MIYVGVRPKLKLFRWKVKSIDVKRCEVKVIKKIFFLYKLLINQIPP